MEPTTQNNTLRSLLIFLIIGAVLLAAVILGVRWARGRSDQLAGRAATPVATTNQSDAQKKADEQKKIDDQRKAAEQRAADDKKKADEKAKQDAAAAQQKKDDQNKVAATPPTTSSTQTTTPSAPTPARVPSTGIEDAFLPIAAIAALVFAGTTYAQSRRRLAHLI